VADGDYAEMLAAIGLKEGEEQGDASLLQRVWQFLGGKAVWNTAYVNKLPDSAFGYIESGGKKDAGGKTMPRSIDKCAAIGTSRMLRISGGRIGPPAASA